VRGRLVLLAFLLAGCAGTGDPGFPWHAQSLEVAHPSGLRLSGLLIGSGGTLNLTATAVNEGAGFHWLATGCNTPWYSELRRVVPQGGTPNGYPIHPYPSVGCDTGGQEALAPGESRSFAFTWNGTLWDGGHQDGGYLRPLPGAYAWSLYFETVGPCTPECQGVALPALNFTVLVP
jgi:hypothetical protein